MSGAEVSRNIADAASNRDATSMSIIRTVNTSSVEATVAANRDILGAAARKAVDGAEPSRGIPVPTASEIVVGDAPRRGILGKAASKIADGAATVIATVKNGVSRAVALTTAIVLGVVLGFVSISILATMSAKPPPPAAADSGSAIMGVMAVLGGATAAVFGLPLVLPALGFGAGGVAAGSVAAAIQSMIGNVAAGSIFAALQSTGVVGLALSTKVGLGSVGAAVGAAFAYLSDA